MPKFLNVISKPVGRTRLENLEARVAPSAIDRDGGSRSAGIIEGASLITLGEAKGHDGWIDSVFLDELTEAANDLPDRRALKVRFTHPGMSDDGLGKYLGRALNVRREGDQVLGDVHFSPSSRDTPDGDLGGYVMDLADDDPEAFGLSIVFDHHVGNESRFVEENRDANGYFESPDSANEMNYPHFRLQKFHGADFVDSPAANPDGLFHSGPSAGILETAESLVEYGLGLSNDCPQGEFGVDPNRLRGFLSRFLDSRGIQLSTNEDLGMPETNEVEPVETETPEVSEPVANETEPVVPAEPAVPETPAPSGETFSKGELQKFSDKFGAEKGLAYLLAGTSFEDALSAEFDELQRTRKLGVDGSDRGEETPVAGSEPESGSSRRGLPKSVAALADKVIRMK